MASLQVPTWAGWQGMAPPLPTAPFAGNMNSFPFPPSPRPTVQDGEDEDTTDIEETSEDESCDGSEAEMENDNTKPRMPDTGKPGEVRVVSADGMAQIGGPPKSPEQVPSLNVLAEIRKMIKQECTKPLSLAWQTDPDVFAVGQMRSSPEPRAADGNLARQAPGLSASTSPTSRCHPPPLLAHTNRAFSPHHAVVPPTPELSHRTQPGVQWSNTVPPPQPAVVPGLPVELSPVDLKWGVLFDQNGLPTKRGEQVVRGIGRYLVSTCHFRKKRLG